MCELSAGTEKQDLPPPRAHTSSGSCVSSTYHLDPGTSDLDCYLDQWLLKQAKLVRACYSGGSSEDTPTNGSQMALGGDKNVLVSESEKSQRLYAGFAGYKSMRY